MTKPHSTLFKRKQIFNFESHYLDGPNSRGNELWFTIEVMFEFIRGFRKLHFVGPCITVFGSARFKSDHPFYQKTVKIGKRIQKLGFTVMTGGGGGIMEAANRGAFENGGTSVGCNIVLPKEQKPNPYMHKWITFKHFFVRKVLLLKYSYAFIVMPGGLGTMDEFFETLTLIQTGILNNFPIVVFGKDYYHELINQLDKMVIEKTISPKDLNLVKFTDDVDEGMEHIKNYILNNYQVKKKKPLRWLLE